MTIQQPEALRLAAMQNKAMTAKFGKEGFDFHVEPDTVIAMLDRIAELDAIQSSYDAARLEIASLQGQLTAAVPAPAWPSEAVAYLDIGTGGYLDLGTDLADEALSRLPKGRHALVIAGTYGIDGYTAASTPQSAPPPQAAPAGVLEDAARWHWMAEYLVGTRTDLDDALIASATVDELNKLIDADLAAQQGGA